MGITCNKKASKIHDENDNDKNNKLNLYKHNDE